MLVEVSKYEYIRGGRGGAFSFDSPLIIKKLEAPHSHTPY